MNERLSVKGLHSSRRHSDISPISKSKDVSDGNRLLVPKSGTKSAGNSKHSLNSSSSISLDLKSQVLIPSPVSPKKSVTFNQRVQVFEHSSWKKKLKRYRKIARKLAMMKDQKDLEDQESSECSSEEETKTDAQVSSGTKTPPRISIN